MKFLWCGALAALSLSAADLRVGIIGTDTSHATAFTRILNDPAHPEHVPGARVVAAYKGGSRDLPESWDRVEKYAEELRAKWNVEIVPDIDTLLTKVDVVLLESVDGRPHLEQARPVFRSGKRVFIDKPLASTWKDAQEIVKLARESGTPFFSSSGLRFGKIVSDLKRTGITGAITWGPGPTEEHHQLDLSWYGVHPIEMLFALLGTGCQEVTRTFTENADEVTCRWKDGRLGSVRALRPYADFGAVVFTAKDIVQSAPKTPFSYGPLIKEIVQFFQTGKPPVAPEETLEMFAFMEAARLSKEQGGKPVRLPLN